MMKIEVLWRGAVLVISLPLLLSCATTYEAAKKAFDNSQPCCAKFSELKYQKFPHVGPALVDLDQTSQVFLFESGKSYVAAFQLPPRPRPISLRLRSFALGENIDRSHIFYPQAVVLDGTHALLARHVFDSLKAIRTDLNEAISENKWGLPVKLETEFVIYDRAASYLAIYTTPTLLSRKSWYVTMKYSPIILQGVVGTVPTGPYPVPVFIQHSPFGRLSLTIEGSSRKASPSQQ